MQAPMAQGVSQPLSLSLLFHAGAKIPAAVGASSSSRSRMPFPWAFTQLWALPPGSRALQEAVLAERQELEGDVLQE